ncbi:MAG TPA: YCF48-related protein [Saprospiraceae bacterium]|nr:YCF48-related protein [Saprospiraceae bacterium]HMQ82191.1 YCF48-related protein [Saprospiraceae bacterium]
MKTKLLTTLIIAGVGIATHAQSVWTPTSNVMNGGGRLEDLFFIHPDTGWTVGGFGTVSRTQNGGESWDLQYQSNYYIRSVDFFDSQLGFAGTLDEVFLRTSDGGETWEDITGELPMTPTGVCGMQHLGDSTLLAVGAWFGPAFILRTEDRGISWDSLNLSDYAEGLIDVHFFSRDTGLVCGRGSNGGIILYTTDGGESWEEVFNTFSAGDYVWKLQFIDEQHAVGSVQTFGAMGWLLKSDDGGLSWVKKPVPIGDAQGVGFVTPLKGWMGGYGNGFFATEDGGNTWELVPFGGNYNRFQFFNANFGFASGAGVYKYQDSTLVGLSAEISSRLFDPALTVSPNPASDEAVIDFSLPDKNNVDLNLYDQQGRLIARIFNGRLPAGQHKMNIKIGDLSQAFLLVGLQVNEGIFSTPLLKQR